MSTMLDQSIGVERVAIEKLRALTDGELMHVEAIDDGSYAVAHLQDAGFVYGTLIEDGDVVTHQVRADGESVLLDGETLEAKFPVEDED